MRADRRWKTLSTVQNNSMWEGGEKARFQAGWNWWRKVSGVICDERVSKNNRKVVRVAMLLRKRQEAERKMFSYGVTRMDRTRYSSSSKENDLHLYKSSIISSQR